MAKKRQDVSKTHKKYIGIGVSSVILLVFIAVFVTFMSDEPLAGKAFEYEGCVEAPEGLVSWWDGDNNYENLINSGLNGVPSGNDVELDDGKVGKAFKFSGGHITVPDDNILDFDTNPFTIEGWINPENLDASYFYTHSLNNPYEGLILGLNSHNSDCTGGKICIWNELQPVKDWQGVTSGFHSNYWYHFAFVHIGGVVSVYIDGNHKKTISDYGSFSADSNLIIGAKSFNNLAFKGFLDELSIYDRALTADDIKSIFDADDKGKCKEIESYTCDTTNNNGEIYRNGYCDGDATQDAGWKLCDADTNNKEVVDEKAYCDGTDWKICDPSIDGDVHGNLYCDGSANKWETCSGVNEGTVTKRGYCNGKTWEQCNDNEVGEIKGDFQYVCGGLTSNYQWNAMNCQTCKGDRPGICTGTNLIDSAGIVSKYYYDNSNYLGCANTETDCYEQSNGAISFDDKVEISSTDYVCGLAHDLVECSVANLPSDGRRWMCEASGKWKECNAASSGDTTSNGFVCVRKDSKWQWDSTTTCTPTTKFQLIDGKKKICDGTSFIECDVAMDLWEDDYTIETSCDSSGFSPIKEHWTACHNGLDDDNDGLHDCADPDCQVSQTLKFGRDDVADGHYQVTLRKDECSGVKFDLT
jgi:hypothetical protein